MEKELNKDLKEEFDKEKILETMRKIREKRELELLQYDMDDINLDSDYQKKLPQNKVLNVKFLGTIEIEGESKEIYLVIEQKEDKEGQISEVERFYDEDGEFLGGNNSLDQYDFVTPSEKYADKDELVRQLEELDKEGIFDLNQIEQERLEEIARELGVDVEDIKRMAEIDAEKELDEDEEREDDELEEEKEESDQPTMTKKQVEKVSTKAEIGINQKVTDKDTMSSLLNVKDKGYKKIAIVYTDKLEENGNSSRFSFVGIKKDGSAEKIDSVQPINGSNPTRKIQASDRTGSHFETQSVNSMFSIKGKDEEQFAVRIGTMGTIEPSFVRTPRQSKQEGVSIPIATQNIKPTTREAMEFMNRSRNTNMKDNLEKIKQHQEVGCNDYTIKDIDDNEGNDLHEHVEMSPEYLDKCATEVLKDDVVASTYNRSDVIARLNNYISENGPQLTTEELIKRVTEEMVEDSSKEHHQQQRSEHQ